MHVRLISVVLLVAWATTFAWAQSPPPAGSDDKGEILKALNQVIEQNHKLEQEIRELRDQMNALRQGLGVQSTASQPAGLANTPAAAAMPQNTPPSDPTLLPEASNGNPGVFGEFNPGRGFTVARGRYGTLNFSGYLAARYLNQLPADQTATDHLGRPLAVDPRRDFQLHRVMLFTQGWLFTPKLQYGTFVWTVQDTNQVAVGGALTYNFNKYVLVGLGWNAYPGTQSLQGSHPYWLSLLSKTGFDGVRMEPSYN